MPKNPDWIPSRQSTNIILDRLLHEGPLYTPDLDKQSEKNEIDFQGNRVTGKETKERVKHSTLRGLLEKLEKEMKIKRLKYKKRANNKKESVKWDLTFIGFLDWMDNVNKQTHTREEINKIIPLCEKWIPWIYSNWNNLIEIYDEVSMFECIISSARQINIDDQSFLGKNITEIKIPNDHRIEKSSEFGNVFIHYNYVLTLNFIHKLLVSSIPQTEPEVMPKHRNSIIRLLRLVKKNDKLWSSYKKNINTTINIYTQELMELEKVANKIKTIETKRN
ncbi:hypothetical protein [Nitrosopumilus sp. b2]|uniref:hypothetical protein n=1 Tax=Nitrosopumilus sp. b2 TaxID=2109908 RepID=UPI0015F54783|nr:hypothetical protein [Nitrosopumilus sp. b2]KAF6245465.1 hypothetical protein C6989_03280 [Nitrosopumilus sp. b2]